MKPPYPPWLQTIIDILMEREYFAQEQAKKVTALEEEVQRLKAKVNKV